MKPLNIILALIIILIVILLAFCNGGDGNGRKVTEVDCATDSLAEAVSNSAGNEDFVVTGDCNETSAVTISQDSVTIDGQGSTITAENEDKAAIKVTNGAQNVVIMNVIVKGGHHGFHIDEDSSALLKEIVVQEGSGAGLFIGNTSPFDTAEDYETAPGKLQGYRFKEKLLPDIEFKFFREAMAQINSNYPAYCVNPLQATLDISAGTTILCSGDIQNREYGIAIINSDLGSANLSVIGNYAGSSLSGLTLLSNIYAGIAIFGQSSVYFYSGQISFSQNGDTHYIPLGITFGDLWTQTGTTVACTPELISQNLASNFGDIILSERTDGIPNATGGMDYQCFPNQ